MTSIDTVVIGGGHAGLAVSRLLTAADREHVVLERGRVAERWRTERWDSLRLLSPNWRARLPGWAYTGADQEGFMPVASFVDYLEAYAESFDAPVIGGTTVERLSARAGGGYDVVTGSGTWQAAHVVIATGPWGTPIRPAGLGADPDVRVISSSEYRNPDQLDGGGVLVIGSSASGAQIADELVRSGRDVTMAVGRHTRMPRRYRGMDMFWWLDRTGRFAQTIDQVSDPVAARNEPSLQLIGHGDDRSGDDLDLAAIQGRGVRLVGRFERLDRRGRAHFGGDLAAHVQAADERMHRFLDAVDRNVDETGLTTEVWPGHRPGPLRVRSAPERLDLRTAGVSTIVLAAGFRPELSWVDLPILDSRGHVRQWRGVTPAPGVYVVGQRFQHRRDSASIDGARHDARSVVGHLCTGEARRSVPVDMSEGETR